jgi:hypothetical protein
VAHVIFSTPDITMRENGLPRKTFHGSLRSCPEDFHRPAKSILMRILPLSTKALTDGQSASLAAPSPSRWLHKKRALTTFSDKVSFLPSMAERIGYKIVANPK